MVSMEASRNQEADAVAYEIRIGRLLISELNNKDEELKRFRRPKRSRSLWVVANAGNSNSGGGGINSDGSGGGNSSCERTAGLLKDALRSVHLLAAAKSCGADRRRRPVVCMMPPSLCGSSFAEEHMHHHALAVAAAGAISPPSAPSAPSASGAAAAEAAAAAAVAASVEAASVASVAAADGLDAFVQLGVLIVEGRVAGAAGAGGARGPRGYAEGPHCAAPAAGTPHARAHQCDPANFLVSVKMLPRMDAPPILHCPLHANGSTAELTPTIPGKQMLTALPAANPGSGGAARVDECAGEPLLGDSLLDPPHSLQLLRGRAPRTSSPPSAILPRTVASAHGRTSTRWRDASPPSPPSSSLPQRRRGRQGMARRRDASSGSSLSSRALRPGMGINSGDLLDDRMLNPCTRPGKHHCRCAYEDDTTDCSSSSGNGVAGSSTSITPVSNIRPPNTSMNVGSNSTVHSPKPGVTSGGSSNRKLSLELSQSEVEEVLAVLRDRNLSSRSSNHCSKNSMFSNSATKEQDANSQICKHHMLPSTSLPQESATEVYHCKPSTSTSKTSHKADLLLDAILRARCPTKILSTALKGCDPDERVTKDRTKVCCDEKLKNCESGSVREMPKKSSSSSVPLLHRRLGQLRGRCSSPPQLQTLQIPEHVAGKAPVRSPELSHVTSASAAQAVSVPSAQETALFRRSLRSAACMVFHCRTGLPLTSSPAPVRRRHDSARFDFDSSLNSVSAIRSALFEASGSPKNGGSLNINGASSPSEDSEASVGSPSSPGISPQALSSPMKTISGQMAWPPRCHISHCSSLLGSFEESVLNGRLEPVSTVQGFTADLGASGAFCPRHLLLPVTVFFYTLGDNDKVSTPYLGHINLGKKGYTVPRSGTIQVTLLNPLGTVVKMFVVQYDLTDMPPQATTFLRQRTLYLPAGGSEGCDTEASINCQALQKHLRYLIHLRFSSSRSGRISLHTDIRMIIFRKSDLDTATAHGGELAYELRSFTHGPTNPKFSPRYKRGVDCCFTFKNSCNKSEIFVMAVVCTCFWKKTIVSGRNYFCEILGKKCKINTNWLSEESSSQNMKSSVYSNTYLVLNIIINYLQT
ncbi:LOW QUALITY PROTEIN: Uncharacterized protein GBIM_15893 [Gryllus bimaculatus]|nr:LOW QUALITY PROTEIN: Uncharacterized protein GBIM_15893 [Gryllus bimaculatus]